MGEVGGPVILTALVVRPSKWPRGWNKCLSLPPDYCITKEEKLVLGIIVCMARRVCNNILLSLGQYDLVTHVEMCFLQISL